MPEARYACGSAAHAVSRRGFLAAAGATAALGPAGFASPTSTAELARNQKRVLVIFLSGGVSQFETWDPKPGTDTGGPFRAISTSVPGTQVCELLPLTAARMHKLAVVRSLNSTTPDHAQGEKIMLTGRQPEAGIEYPHIGAVAAKMLGGDRAEMPGNITILPGGGGGGRADATFLGPQFASVPVPDGRPPANLLRPSGLTPDADAAREALRRSLTDRFSRSRRSAASEAYAASFAQAERVFNRADVFDVERESLKTAERYGRHDFGRHLLLARRLLEAGVSYVKVSHSNYDTHHENFDFHIEQLGEFDRPFAALLDDLSDRGMLESTLVVVMSEMGRTPRINERFGRDHWSNGWSVVLGGAGIKGGALVGRTNANGTTIADREVGPWHLFHTYLRAVGLDPERNFHPNQRPVPVADPRASAISEILA